MENSGSGRQYLAHISKDGARRQSVYEHLLASAQLARGFAEPFGGGDEAYVAGLLHDIGKYSSEFQHRLEGGQKVDHSTAGAKEAWNIGQFAAALCIAGHHSGLLDFGSNTDTEDSGTFQGRMKKPLPNYDEWKREVSLPSASKPKALPPDCFTQSFYVRMLYSCLVDADYLDTETFMNGGKAPRGGYVSMDELHSRLNTYVSGWWDAKTELNRMRCDILRACFEQGRHCAPGLFSLTVPTGGGKTISSLAFALAHAAAHGKRRVIYVIPYTSIIDQTADIFKKALGEENIIEHHSGAEIQLDENEVSEAARRKALATENWDAPIIVTTAVQFFESIFSNRSSRCRKLHNISDSVIIFDEAQTLPVPYLRPCVAAIGQLVRYYGASAVLCTATQPELGELFKELAGGLSIQEICPDTARLYKFFRRTALRHCGEISIEALAAEINANTQALCVVNRRADAQRLYELFADEGRYCLTTLLCPADRKHLLAEIRERLKNGLPCRLAATSLIEAGVDVDFPAAWREETGLDSVLQTAGRCNREGRRKAEESLVTVFTFEGQRPLPTLRSNIDSLHWVMRSGLDLASPEAISEYFEFFRRLKGSERLDENDVLRAFSGRQDSDPLPFASVAENFRLIDSPTVTVYIPVGNGAELIKELLSGQYSRSLYRKLGQYAVNVYPEHLNALRAAGAVAPADENSFYLLDTNLYDSRTGLKLDIETGQGLYV